MKKYLICLLAVFILSNCEVKFKEVKAQQQIGRQYFYNDFYEYNMHYRLFSYYDYDGGAAVVNFTKDSLEVELLRKQLKK